MAARDDNFLNDGTVDPFAGLAPAEDPSTAEAARRLALRRSATATANINLPSGGVDPSGMPRGQSINPATGQPYTGDERPAGKGFWKESWDTVKQHPWLLALPAAPFAVAGAGAAATGTSLGSQLGFGLGEGSMVGGAGGVTQAANEATGLAQAGPGFSQESANAYNAANATNNVGTVLGPGGVPAAAGTSAAGGPMTASGFATKYGLPIASSLVPLAINQMNQGKTKEEKALIAKQQQMADEAKVRQGQQQDARMNALGQQMLAFNPSNQMMAQMFGPQAAFSPDQAAQMVQGQAPADDPAIMNYTGTDQAILKQKREMIRRKNEYAAAEAQRHDMMMNGMQPLGAGPAPIQMSAPQAARKY